MRRLLSRLYRYVFNPTPQEGQYWVVEGLGRVLVVGKGTDSIIYANGIPLAGRHYAVLQTHDGVRVTWALGDVRVQGYLWQPASLEDVGTPPKRIR